MSVIVPTGVVQESEQDDDIPPQARGALTEKQPLFQHARPMRGSMESPPVEPILAPDFNEQPPEKGRLYTSVGL
jgi:hypothetical protein